MEERTLLRMPSVYAREVVEEPITRSTATLRPVRSSLEFGSMPSPVREELRTIPREELEEVVPQRTMHASTAVPQEVIPRRYLDSPPPIESSRPKRRYMDEEVEVRSSKFQRM